MIPVAHPCAKRSALQALIFDGAIVGILAISAATLSWTIPLLTSSLAISPVYRGLLVLASIVMGGGALLVLWGSFIEPLLVFARRKTVAIPLQTSLRIAVVSDFHVGVYHKKRFVEKIVRHINALTPDLILLPGDFLDDEESDIADLSPLKNLRAKYGVFATTGNHDAGAYMSHFRSIPYFKKDRTEDIKTLLTSFGIIFLRNDTHTLQINGETLIVAGTDDPFMRSFDPAKTFRSIPPHAPVILLSHVPDIILEQESRRAHLIVSGHTHGGQIRLPIIGVMYKIPDKIGKHFDRGIFKITKTCTLAITEGVGVTGVRARLFCPPEILLITTFSR